jgi:hypothetical protein
MNMFWNRETEVEARVGPGRQAAPKAIDKTTAGFARWSVTKLGAGMRLAGTRKGPKGLEGGFRPGDTGPLSITSFTSLFDRTTT